MFTQVLTNKIILKYDRFEVNRSIVQLPYQMVGDGVT